jgi:uncharacterized repeat protein (TIGR03803 family)
VKLHTALPIAIVGAGMAIHASPGYSANIQVLHNFCETGSCTRSFANAPLLMDQAGNLYGTSWSDGAKGKGTVYELIHDSVSGQWTYRVLHDFCSRAHCHDGSTPDAALVIDTDGNLYGTTIRGGRTDHGVFFRVSAAGKYNVLYSFCPANDTCPDGANPSGPLTYVGASSGMPYDGRSALYGTGEDTNSFDKIFELRRSNNWHAHAIYSDCCAGGVVMDAVGNLYGIGGPYGSEAVVRLSRSRQKWVQTGAYSFSEEGYQPEQPLVVDQKGNVYGTLQHGGKYNDGLIYKLEPVVDTFVFKDLHDFGNGSGQGVFPFAGLTADGKGNLFGTTYGGGVGHGTVFELSGKIFQTLYSFCATDGCANGSVPVAGVILDGQGNVYGTTTLGGANAFGTAFEIIP